MFEGEDRGVGGELYWDGFAFETDLESDFLFCIFARSYIHDLLRPLSRIRGHATGVRRFRFDGWDGVKTHGDCESFENPPSPSFVNLCKFTAFASLCLEISWSRSATSRESGQCFALTRRLRPRSRGI